MCVWGLLMEYPTAWESQQQQKNKRDMEEEEGEEERGNIKARMKINGKNEAWGLAESERCRKGDRWSIEVPVTACSHTYTIRDTAGQTRAALICSISLSESVMMKCEGVRVSRWTCSPFFKVAGEKKMRRKFLIRDGQDGWLIVHQLTRRLVRSTSFFGEVRGLLHYSKTHSLQRCFSDNLQWLPKMLVLCNTR